MEHTHKPIAVTAMFVSGQEVVIIDGKPTVGGLYIRRNEIIVQALIDQGYIVVTDPLAKPQPRPEASVQDGSHGI